MKLKEARSLAIKYCVENNCNYTYISHNNAKEFFLTADEDKHTVFLVNKNGSLGSYRDTRYAVDFHKELKKRKKNKKRNAKKAVADMLNHTSLDDGHNVIEKDLD